MNDTSPRDRLDALVFDYLERVEAGESPNAVLAELSAAHPGEAAALARGVGLLRDVRLHPGAAEDGLPERVGPFRLLQRLGSGGMGVVYLAEQENPTRRVAVKLVRPDQLWFEGYRERFTREIESAARLAHPGIAPVYEMGEHDGIPWFSQEYVIGATLSEILESLPGRAPEMLRGSDLRSALVDALEDRETQCEWNAEFFDGTWVDVCLRIARQIADALAHAHANGVLHRDVKPSNILLSPAGRAVLVDFGLASLQGTERLTQTGAQVGSLHYMSPEQVDGRVEEIGPRSDVYSLGVTLYELLTLRAPYSSQSVQRLHGMILQGDAPAARTLNRAVGPDASLVVACAMDAAAARRYESAAAFAADLAAAGAHRPIQAKPPGALRRLTNWSRRKPTAAVGLVAGFGLLVVAPVAFGFQSYVQAEDERELSQALNRTLEERDVLIDATLEGFDGVIRWTAHADMQELPGFQEERLQVIEQGLAIFERVLAARSEDLDIHWQRAMMQCTRANILASLGREQESAAQLDAVLASLELVVELGLDDLDKWNEIETDIEAESPVYPRVRELGAIVRRRAGKE